MVLLKVEMVEHCRFTVDIGSLPSFKWNAVYAPYGFFTGRLKQSDVLKWFTNSDRQVLISVWSWMALRSA